MRPRPAVPRRTRLRSQGRQRPQGPQLRSVPGGHHHRRRDTYCQPPPPSSCPAEHAPKVVRDHAYCEPPPLEPCPEGSFWTSTSATETFCRGGRPCDGPSSCAGGRCVESKLCVRAVRHRRYVEEVVSGVCENAKDCPAGEQCVEANRCVPRGPQRIATSPAATVPVVPSAASPPAATTAPSDQRPGSTTSATSSAATPPARSPSSRGCAGCRVPRRRPARWPSAIWAMVAAACLARRRRSRVATPS